MRSLTLITALCCGLGTGAASAQTWSDITPPGGPAPTPRTLSGAVYDPVAHAMVIFAGEDAGGRRNDVWAFDLASGAWSDITPALGSAPAGRITPAAVYDPDHHTLLTFAGQGAGNQFFNDTWAFDLSAGTWSQFSPPGPVPAIRYGVATVYDPVANTQVTFAGFTFQGRFDDTWRFDPAADDWGDVSPPAGSPLERCLHVACFDAMNRVMIMYGGQNGGPLGDIWKFDLNTEMWTDVTPAGGPAPRWFSTLEYDPLKHRAIMFSGNRGPQGRANDLWAFDLWVDDWFALSPSGTPPSARDGAASIYIASEDRIVVFGGRTDVARLNDVWSLDDVSDPTTSVGGGGTPVAGAVLHQNFPNPFNPSTRIAFELSAAAPVRLTVYDLSGRVVRRLVGGPRSVGLHSVEWDGRDDRGERVGSGVYFYRLDAGSFVRTKKMTLLK